VNCPVMCKYCMAVKINQRSKHWSSGERLGVNKSCVFVNRLPNDPPLKDMPIDWSLFDGDYLGFQGITDCFWNIYIEDLKWIVEKVENSLIRKLVLISKIPINQQQLDILKQTNKIIVMYSLTGLDKLEKTKTVDRIDSMIELRKNNIDTLGVIHPYIHQYSDLSFLKKLKDNNFDYVACKGFRYNPENMLELKKYIPARILEQYKDDENEVMIGERYLLNKLSLHNIKAVDMKKYIRSNNKIDLNLEKEKIEKQVEELFKIVVISSSEKDLNIIKNDVINRRLGKETF
jgi:DNA repair photolyase